MGYFSLPEGTTKQDKINCAISNLDLWKRSGGKEGFDYLLSFAISFLVDGYLNDSTPEGTKGKILECSKLSKKVEKLKEELRSFVQDKSNPIADRFKVWVEIYDAGIICHENWVVGDSAFYCDDYSRYETVDIIDMVSEFYANDPRSIELLFDAVDACVHTFTFDW